MSIECGYCERDLRGPHDDDCPRVTGLYPCHRCGQKFNGRRGLGQHDRHAREAVALGRKNRICPDRRTDEEARASALNISRVRAKLKMLRGEWA